MNIDCKTSNYQHADTLAEILKALRLQANTIYCNDFASPWGIDVAPKIEMGLFHIVVSGSCWIKTPDMDIPTRLDTGDVVALPTGSGHWISDMPQTPKMPSDALMACMLNDENPFACCEEKPSNITSMLCGSFRFATSMNHPFLRDLPAMIHIKAAEHPELEWLRTIMKILAKEAKTPSPGSTVMVDRLTEILFIQLIRAHINSQPCGTCYFSALADEQIGTALNLIHGEQQANLTVEKLCQLVAMSRTAFTEKFSSLIGMTPKSYLLNWRMHKAKSQLETSSHPMIVIAENSGYSSEAAFSKAFKQFFGETPGKIRKLATA